MTHFIICRRFSSTKRWISSRTATSIYSPSRIRDHRYAAASEIRGRFSVSPLNRAGIGDGFAASTAVRRRPDADSRTLIRLGKQQLRLGGHLKCRVADLRFEALFLEVIPPVDSRRRNTVSSAVSGSNIRYSIHAYRVAARLRSTAGPLSDRKRKLAPTFGALVQHVLHTLRLRSYRGRVYFRSRCHL